MLNVASECVNHTPFTDSSYTLGDFAEELIRILPKAPEAFSHLLTLALDSRFGTDSEDVHSMINYIAESVGESKLKGVLSDIDCNNRLMISQTPILDDNVKTILDDSGMQLAILLSRHMYLDLSETDSAIAASSKKAIQTGSGAFKTAFMLSGCQVVISTDMASGVPNIGLA